MTLFDYILDLGLIGLVLIQIRGRRLTVKSLLIPFAVVGWAAANYLRGIPTGGNDLLLVVAGAGTGLLLGGLAGLFTRVWRRNDGALVAKAGGVAAVLWVLGTGSRFAFQLYVSHGGVASVARFSAAHHITSGAAWTACILLMAIGEVVARSAVLLVRASRETASAGGASALLASLTSRPAEAAMIGAGAHRS